MRLTRKKSIKFLLWLFAGLFMYSGAYLYLTLHGDWYLTQSGERRWVTGLSVTDMIEWRPRGLWWQGRFKNIEGRYVSRGNTPGYFYSPLIALDRTYWHNPEILLGPDNFWVKSSTPEHIPPTNDTNSQP